MIDQGVVKDSQEELTVEDLTPDYWQYQPIGVLVKEDKDNIPLLSSSEINTGDALTVPATVNSIAVPNVVIDTGAVQSIVQYDWLKYHLGKDLPIQKVSNPNLTSVKGDLLEVFGQLQLSISLGEFKATHKMYLQKLYNKILWEIGLKILKVE